MWGQKPVSGSQKPGKDQCPSSSGRRVSILLSPLFCSGLQLTGWGPPTLGKMTCFTQSTKLTVNAIQKHPHRHTQNNIWLNVWVPTGGPVKLTHKINHQSNTYIQNQIHVDFWWPPHVIIWIKKVLAARVKNIIFQSTLAWNPWEKSVRQRLEVRGALGVWSQEAGEQGRGSERWKDRKQFKTC